MEINLVNSIPVPQTLKVDTIVACKSEKSEKRQTFCFGSHHCNRTSGPQPYFFGANPTQATKFFVGHSCSLRFVLNSLVPGFLVSSNSSESFGKMSDYTHDVGMKLEMGGDLLRRQFDPTAHDLDSNFRLTRFADLKGRGCKVPQDVLNKLVGSLQQDYSSHDDQFMHMAIPRIGIGLDCSVTPLRHGGLCLVQTTDFFYPIVDDPYMMGKIACANVLSDLYAMGVIECDNMLMLLAVSTKMTEKERDVVIPLIMRGFKVSSYQFFE